MLIFPKMNNKLGQKLFLSTQPFDVIQATVAANPWIFFIGFIAMMGGLFKIAIFVNLLISALFVIVFTLWIIAIAVPSHAMHQTMIKAHKQTGFWPSILWVEATDLMIYQLSLNLSVLTKETSDIRVVNINLEKEFPADASLQNNDKGLMIRLQSYEALSDHSKKLLSDITEQWINRKKKIPFIFVSREKDIFQNIVHNHRIGNNEWVLNRKGYAKFMIQSTIIHKDNQE